MVLVLYVYKRSGSFQGSHGETSVGGEVQDLLTVTQTGRDLEVRLPSDIMKEKTSTDEDESYEHSKWVRRRTQSSKEEK